MLLFHILAPEEIDFPFKKWTQFRDLEISGNKMLVDPQRLRRDYQQNFQKFCNDLRNACGQAQVDYHLMRTDESVEKALGFTSPSGSLAVNESRCPKRGEQTTT